MVGRRSGRGGEESVIPNCCVKNKSVRWPSGTNVMKAMRDIKPPEEHWLKFDLMKIKFTSGYEC